MMTPEKATMADMSGGKRDRISNHTDQPASTPNTRDTKLLCNGDKDPIGKGNEGKLVEIEQPLDSDKINATNDGIGKQAQKEVIDVDDNPDVLDDLIASGGLDKTSGSDIERLVPKTLFGSPKDNEEESNETGSSEWITVSNKTIATDAQDGFSTPTKNPVKKDKNINTPTKTEGNNKNDKNNNKKNNKKTEKENKKNQETITTIKTSDNDKKGSNDKAVLVINIDDGYKPATMKWKMLDSNIKEIYGLSYKRSDYDKKLRTAFEKVLLHLNIDDKNAEFSRDEWVKNFIAIANLPAKKDNKLIKRFAISLAATDPQEMFNSDQFDGINLIKGPIENAWAAAYTLYGAGWLPEIGLDISTGIAPPTKWWKDLKPADTSDLAPYLTKEIFWDDEKSMHDQEKKFKRKFGINKHLKIVPTKDWIAGFKKHLDDPITRAAVIKLAITPITVFDSHHFSDKSGKTKLHSISITTFWIAAYRIAGAPWNLKDPPTTVQSTPSPEPATATPSPKQEQTVSFDTAAKKPPGLFISRPAHVPTKSSKPKAEIRKYQDGFYSVKTTALESEWKVAGPEITGYFNKIVEHIMSKDKKALIHRWNTEEGNAISKRSPALTNRMQVRKHTNSLYLRQGLEVEFRIRVSHEVHPTKLEIDSISDGLDIKYDHIQARDYTCIGYLLGTSPAANNLTDMQEAHENHPVITGLRIIARVQAIKLAAGKNAIPWELQVKAIHIFVGANHANEARERYSKVYGSRNIGGYPQAIHARFVPDISDLSFPVTASTRIKAIKSLAKQKAFLAHTKQIHTSTIAGLHSYHPTIKFTLCQVLMSMRSIDNPDLGLFISIDDDLSEKGYEVIFSVHLDRFNEASSLIPLLCILLQAKFGMGIDRLGWFTDDAKKVLTKYKWSPEEECVVLIHPDDEADDLGFDSDDEYMNAICNIFNIDSTSDGNGFEFDMNFVVEDDIRPKNQYGDTGSIKTFRHAFDADGGVAAEASEAAAAMDTTPAADDESKPPAVSSTLAELLKSNLSLEEKLSQSDPELVRQLILHLETLRNGSPKTGVAEN